MGQGGRLNGGKARAGLAGIALVALVAMAACGGGTTGGSTTGGATTGGATTESPTEGPTEAQESEGPPTSNVKYQSGEAVVEVTGDVDTTLQVPLQPSPEGFDWSEYQLDSGSLNLRYDDDRGSIVWITLDGVAGAATFEDDSTFLAVPGEDDFQGACSVTVETFTAQEARGTISCSEMVGEDERGTIHVQGTFSGAA